MLRARATSMAPGELEGKNNMDFYISPSKSPHSDFIPAFKGVGRKLPMSDAFNSEASTLQDADLDLRIRSNFDRVFSNTMFDDTPKAPGSIKMNSFLEPSDKRTDHKTHKDSPDRESNPDKMRMISGLFKRVGSTARSHPDTVVETFDASTIEDEDAPIVARPRAALAMNMREKSMIAWESELKQIISSGRREEAVFRPAPSEGLVKCYVKRVKNFFGTHCSFQMHLENGDVFLLAARRRKKSKVSSYIISQDLEDLKRDTDNCLAKLKSNFVGTEYSLWGRSDDKKVKKGYAKEQLCINYKHTALTAKGGPRAMYVIMPSPDTEWHPSSPDGSDSLSNCLEMAKEKELPPYLERKVAMATTKPPEYDDNLKAYTLDFHGRVKEASVKNFQLVHWDHNTDRKGSQLMLQFGKVAEDVYALDFAYPMNIEAAFAVALASIDTKLCYTI